MTKPKGMTKLDFQSSTTDSGVRASNFGLLSTFDIRHSDFSYWHSRFFLIHNPDDEPANGTFVISYRFSGGEAVGRNQHPLVHGGAVGVNGHLRDAFRSACAVDGLADDQAPARKAWVLAGSGEIAFDAS